MRLIAVLYWVTALACLCVVYEIANWTYTWNIGAWRMFWAIAEMMFWTLCASFLVYLGILAKRKAEGNFNFKGSIRREKVYPVIASDLGPVIPDTSPIDAQHVPSPERATAIGFDKSIPNGRTMRHTPSLRNARRRKEEAIKPHHQSA